MFSLDEYFFCAKNKNKKKITFNCKVDVILIPNLYEYQDIITSLWWSKTDLLLFRKSSRDELYELIQRHDFTMPLKQAMKFLYQPGNMTIVYDKQNFEEYIYSYQ
jgi:hypothetical protein